MGGAINSLKDWVLAEGSQESNLIVVFGSPDSKEGSRGARGLGCKPFEDMKIIVNHDSIVTLV